MSTRFTSSNHYQKSGISQNHLYYEIFSGFALPICQNIGTQIPFLLHPIYKTLQINHNKNLVHEVFLSATNRPGLGTYHKAAHFFREIFTGVGDTHSYNNSISSNTDRLLQNNINLPTFLSFVIVVSTIYINNRIYKGLQQEKYNIHKAPKTIHYIFYRPKMSSAISNFLYVYYCKNAQ